MNGSESKNATLLLIVLYGYVITTGGFWSPLVVSYFSPSLVWAITYYLSFCLVLRAAHTGIFFVMSTVMVTVIGVLKTEHVLRLPLAMKFASQPILDHEPFVFLYIYLQLPIIFLFLNLDYYRLQYETRHICRHFPMLSGLMYLFTTVLGIRERLVQRTIVSAESLFQRGVECRTYWGRVANLPNLIVPVIRSAILEFEESVDYRRMMNLRTAQILRYQPELSASAGPMSSPKLFAIVLVFIVIARFTIWNGT